MRCAAILALLLAALNAAPVGAASASVSIIDTPRPQEKWGYAPVNVRVPAGSWVTWSNSGEDAHTVTADDGSFDSGELNPSEGYSYFFTEAGTYAYVCTLHPWMTGQVIVSADG